MKDTEQLCQECMAFLETETQGRMDPANNAPEQMPNALFLCVNWPGISEQGAKVVDRTLQAVWSQHTMRHEPIEGCANADTLWDDIVVAANHVRESVQAGQFGDEGMIMVAHFLSVNDPSFRSSLESIVAIEKKDILGIGHILHWVFFFCDFATPTQEKEGLNDLIWAKEQIKSTSRLAIVCMGRAINGGGRLSDERMLENYRAAADILLLANTNSYHQEGYANIRRDMLHQFQQLEGKNGRFMTVSYTLDQKPYRDIVHASLHSIIGDYRAKAQASYENHRSGGGDCLVGHEFLSLFKGKAGGIACLERSFQQQLAQEFPNSSAFELLPNNNQMGACEKRFKNEKMNTAQAYQLLNEQSEGFLEAFVQLHFVDAVQSRLAQLKQEVSADFRDALKAEFAYLEMDRYFDEYEAYLLAATPAKQSVPNDFLAAAHAQATYMAKQAYYQQTIPVLQQSVRELREQAREFVRCLTTCETAFTLQPSPPDAQVTSVPDYYSDKVKMFLDRPATAKQQSAISLCTQVADVCQGLYAEFCKLMNRNEDVFYISYEDELAHRLPQDHVMLSAQKILAALSDRSFQTRYRMVITDVQAKNSYCILNRNASFRDSLDETLGAKFLTNGVDCAERLMCFEFEPEYLVGV